MNRPQVHHTIKVGQQPVFHPPHLRSGEKTLQALTDFKGQTSVCVCVFMLVGVTRDSFPPW